MRGKAKTQVEKDRTEGKGDEQKSVGGGFTGLKVVEPLGHDAWTRQARPGARSGMPKHLHGCERLLAILALSAGSPVALQCLCGSEGRLSFADEGEMG